MTAFFIPSTPTGKKTGLAYERMRAYAEHEAGRAARPARIFKLSCRSQGADRETCVGKNDMRDGEKVFAIFDVGGDYLVLGRGRHEMVGKRQTYSTVEFD